MLAGLQAGTLLERVVAGAVGGQEARSGRIGHLVGDDDGIGGRYDDLFCKCPGEGIAKLNGRN